VRAAAALGLVQHAIERGEGLDGVRLRHVSHR
jgi:hypothetical protein